MISVPQAFAMACQYYQAGQWQQAELLCREILQADAGQADALHLLGVIAMQTGRAELGVDCLRTALQLRPDFADAHSNLGNCLLEQGKPAEAEVSLRQALRLRPDFAEAHNNLGISLRRQGKPAEAVASLEQALRLRPNYAEAHNALGICLQELGKPAEAMASFEQALYLNPNYAEAHHNLGLGLQSQDKLAEAAAHFQQAVLLKPHHVDAHNNLGSVLLAQGKLEEAAACCRQALALKPDFAEAHNNLGNILREQGNLADAEVSFRQALSGKPDSAEVHNNLGNVLLMQLRPKEAVPCFQQALRLKPDLADAHLTLGTSYLLLGNFERGWPEYEWRMKFQQVAPGPAPRWDGGSLTGKTIVLHAEQGAGDNIQFIRYAAVVKERGATVVFDCYPSLCGVLASCPGIDHLVPRGGVLPAGDVQAPLLSLPGLCGTTLASVPARIPYLIADRGCVKAWQDRLAVFPGFKVGICWQGTPTYKYDKHRSVPLTQFAPLTEVPGLRLVCLQQGAGREQWDQLPGQWPSIELPKRPEEPAQAWMDSAALICALDLVITVDTAVAHLAGALGVPVWVALPFAPDWRWLLERDDSPWYPSMRLFRQSRPGDWPGVFQRIRDALERQIPAAQPA
jgi:Flp pilus assembly protein TadD